jgi:hypothetical protein
MWQSVMNVMSSWHQGKLFIEHTLRIEHGTLHVMVGMLLWLVFALLLRRPITSWAPWLLVFAVILWNETVDLWFEVWPDPGRQYGEGFKDILLTMFVPTILMLAARVRPDLFRGSAGRARPRRR